MAQSKQLTGFGSRLRAIREGQGYTREEAATAAGLNIHQYTKYETGEREPMWPTVLKIARGLSVTPNDFRSPDEC